MKINNISFNRGFGQLNIETGAEKILYSQILAEPRDEYVLREMLLDTIEVQKSRDNNINVYADGRVDVDSEWTGGRSSVGGRNLLERFETALRAARSDKYQAFLTEKRKNPYIDV